MTIVRMYKATDGSLHDTSDKHAAHQTALNIVAAVNEQTFNMNAFTSTDCGDEKVLYAGDIGHFVAHNAIVLREILEKSVVAARGRKKKAA